MVVVIEERRRDGGTSSEGSGRTVRMNRRTLLQWLAFKRAPEGTLLSVRDLVSGYSGVSGFAMDRHICADGLLSYPRPSAGCLNWRPTISTKGSMLTSTPSWKE